MKNILYVSPFAWVGGGELSLIAILKNLDKQAYKARVVCYEEGHFPDKLRELGFECAVLRRGPKLWDWLLILKLIRYIRENKIDIVHVNSLDIRAAIAAKLSGVPLAGHLRVIFPFAWPDALFVRLSAVTIAVSQAVREAFCREFPDLRNKFRVIPPLIDINPAEIFPVDLRKEFNIAGEARLIGIAARLDPFKGHDVFLRAAATIKERLPQARFFIIGGSLSPDKEEKEYFKRIEELVSRLGLSSEVIFTGFRDDVVKVMAGLDVLVASSRSLPRGKGLVIEGFGRVVPEAMCLGVSVVASSSGGLKEIIENGVNGLLVEPNDYKQTAEAVISILTNPQKSRQMRQAAKEKFERCYSAKNIHLITDIYGMLLEAKL